MTAYRHEDYGTGTSHTRRFYLGVMTLAAVIGGGLAVLTWA